MGKILLKSAFLACFLVMNAFAQEKPDIIPYNLEAALKTVLSNHVSKLYYSGDDRLYIALKTKRKLSQNRFYSSLLYWDHINTVDVKLPSDTTEIFQIIEFDSSIFLFCQCKIQRLILKK